MRGSGNRPAMGRLNEAQFKAMESKTVDMIAASPGGGGSLPNGGTLGQVMVKQSSTDGDADWENVVLNGGNANG